MATYSAELTIPPGVIEAAKDPRDAEVMNAIPEPVIPLVHAPAFVAYGIGSVATSGAHVIPAEETFAGSCAANITAACTVHPVLSLAGVGSAAVSVACVGSLQSVVTGAGTLALGAASAVGSVVYSGSGLFSTGGARLFAGADVLAGDGELAFGAPTLVPKGAPGRVTLTARPTTSVVAWAVPR